MLVQRLALIGVLALGGGAAFGSGSYAQECPGSGCPKSSGSEPDCVGDNCPPRQEKAVVECKGLDCPLPTRQNPVETCKGLDCEPVPEAQDGSGN